MVRSLTLPALAAAALLTTGATPAPSPALSAALSPGEIVAAAPAADWVVIAPDDLLVMALAPDTAGRARRIVIQLMPAPFSQGWIDNIRTLATAHWWDGTSVNRVQDNYVAQWGDATEQKPLPPGLRTMPESAYAIGFNSLGKAAREKLMADHLEIEADLMEASIDDPAPSAQTPPSWNGRDGYAAFTGFVDGWPIAQAGGSRQLWPVHCYGMVGVGRNLSPDTGSGAELYTVIGHAPRHLDRNIALVGRVIAGIEHLSSLPRGSEALGFYATPAERTPIVSIRLASTLPVGEQPRFEYLSTESMAFARYADARANRRDPFFNVPAGGADICNIPVPIRPAK